MANVGNNKVPAWHHPHLITAKQHNTGTRWQFKPFTGDEPEPKIPGSVKDAWKAAEDSHPQSSDIGQAVSEARRSAYAEEHAAYMLWRVARHNRQVVALLRDIAPLVGEYQQARQRAVDAYEQLRGTPDGFWQAQLLTLADQRRAALQAARRLSGQAYDLATIMRKLPDHVLAKVPPLSELEETAGVDLGDWYPQERYHGDGADARALMWLFAAQDELIKQATRLFADGQR